MKRMKRATVAAAMLVLTFLAAEVRSAPPKPLPADVGAGRIAWFDLTTTDLARSKDFYGKLFDWKFEPVEGSDQTVEIVAGGTPIGTMRTADGKPSLFNGVVYVQVTDLPAACRKVEELGGKVAPGFPFNLPDGRGAIGLLADPSGHPIGLYSRTRLAPARSASR